MIARGVFTSVKDLSRKLLRYIRAYSKTARPFKWKYFSVDAAGLKHVGCAESVPSTLRGRWLIASRAVLCAQTVNFQPSPGRAAL